ncbi:hypothetical protein MTR_6g045497 [Medicago truncatula]|uniref:Uncharacterized protein n=1 Tax=Medicago truncatula TaxID=3880 RepID=A0A072UAP0_MEDTR|nr:hypothetical protein MTR_6g045497 [Medicago truncatula]
MRLASNVTSPARIRATSFTCRLTNYTLELVKKELNRDQHDEIMYRNSNVSSRLTCKTSEVSLESVSKPTLSNCSSLSHYKAE